MLSASFLKRSDGTEPMAIAIEACHIFECKVVKPHVLFSRGPEVSRSSLWLRAAQCGPANYYFGESSPSCDVITPFSSLA